MEKDYYKQFDDIRTTMKYEKDYYKCILQCKTLLKSIENIVDVTDNYILWACNYDIALCYKKIGEIDKSIKYANTSMLFEAPEQKRIQSLWLLALCYEEKHMIRDAVRMYLGCSKLYKQYKEKEDLLRLRGCVLFNAAKTKKRPKLLMQIIETVQNSFDYTYKDMVQTEVSKYEILKQMYCEFIDFCKENNYQQYIFQILHNIKDNNLKKEIQNYTFGK